MGLDADMRLDKVQIVSLFIEASLYGIEVPFFIVTIYLLHGMSRNKSWICRLFFSMLMFGFNTIHLGTNLRRLINAFTIGAINDPSSSAPDDYFKDTSSILYRLKTILIVIQIVTLDILIAYRCYLIWDRKRSIVLVPAFSVTCYIVVGITCSHVVALSGNNSDSIALVRRWLGATLCLALFIKILFLGTILFGSLLPRASSQWQNRYLKSGKYAAIKKVTLIATESGVLAGLGLLVLIPVFMQGRHSQSLMLDALSPLTGISFLVIIVTSLLGLTPSNSSPSHKRKLKPVVPNNRATLPRISTSIAIYEHQNEPSGSDSLISPYEEKSTLQQISPSVDSISSQHGFQFWSYK